MYKEHHMLLDMTVTCTGKVRKSIMVKVIWHEPKKNNDKGNTIGALFLETLRLHALKSLGYIQLYKVTRFPNCHLNRKSSFCNQGRVLKRHNFPRWRTAIYMHNRVSNRVKKCVVIMDHDSCGNSCGNQEKQVMVSSEISLSELFHRVIACYCIYGLSWRTNPPNVCGQNLYTVIVNQNKAELTTHWLCNMHLSNKVTHKANLHALCGYGNEWYSNWIITMSNNLYHQSTPHHYFPCLIKS